MKELPCPSCEGEGGSERGMWIECSTCAGKKTLPVPYTKREKAAYALAKEELKSLRSIRVGIFTLLVNFDEDSSAGRHFTKDERAAVAAVRAWLKRTESREAKAARKLQDNANRSRRAAGLPEVKEL